jgi:hypothetical protein
LSHSYRYRLHDTTGDDLGLIEHHTERRAGDVVVLPDDSPEQFVEGSFRLAYASGQSETGRANIRS